MSVYDLLELYIEENDDMEIYDLSNGKTVFKGTVGDCLYSDFAGCEVCSYGVENGKLVVNVE